MIILSKKKKKIFRKIITISLFIVGILAVYLTGRLLPREAADRYSSEVFPAVVSGPQRISAMTGVSLTEITVVTIGCLILPVLIIWIVLLIKKAMTRGLGKYLYKSARNVLAVIMVLLVLFEILHGFNFRRTSARAMMELGTSKITAEDLFAAFEWSYKGMIKARSELEEDENGVAKLATGFEETSKYAGKAVETFCAKYGIAKYKSFARAKSVGLSHYWSWTNIVGMYNPVYGEANVNTDYYDVTSIPTTVCHELCHAKGFANETDCNMIGALACIESDRADFRYAGYYSVYFTLLAEIDKLCKAEGIWYDTHIYNVAFLPVVRDYTAYVKYWKSIDKEVLDFEKRIGINITKESLEANNKFLESNGEKGGNETYNVPNNAYVDYYLKYVLSGGKNNA